MKYIVTIVILIVFTAPMAFANGGPTFDQLYAQSHKGKQVVELIDQSSKKDGAKQQICLKNVAQNKVEKKPC